MYESTALTAIVPLYPPKAYDPLLFSQKLTFSLPEATIKIYPLLTNSLILSFTDSRYFSPPIDKLITQLQIAFHRLMIKRQFHVLDILECLNLNYNMTFFLLL
eukprot:jgi/Orpsp1_1/1185808/evm.model.c7180000095414.2